MVREAVKEKGKVKTRRQLNEEKIALCKKYSVKDIPGNPTILSFAKKMML